MAQSNFEERIDTYEIESTNVMTGDRDQSRYLYYQLKMSIDCVRYYFNLKLRLELIGMVILMQNDLIIG